MELVILAAGMGSRFGGLKQIEPMDEYGNFIIDYSIYDAINVGFKKVVFIIKKENYDIFRDTVGKRVESHIEVEYVFQELDKLPDGYNVPDNRVKPWGTAHAILCCKDVVKENFAIINSDDFYGRDAFRVIAEFLSKDNSDSEYQEYAMAGYKVKNTLTENGYVSRGVCEIENGELKSVTERTKIMDCKFTEDDGATWTQLPEDTVVSMNLWGFRPDVFGYIETGFKKFLDEKIDVPKSEYYLPTVVSERIERKEKSVKVLIAEDKWYGVTYKEDKQVVVDAIGKMVADGCYEGL